jgi:hypothetical protein
VLPNLTQIHGWDTTHLTEAADSWSSAASTWERAFTNVHQAALAPGGTSWEGAAATAALTRTTGDRAKVLQAVDNLHHAADVARTGATEIAGARQRTLNAIAAARNAGFTVSDDLTVADTRTQTSTADHLVRQNQARTLAHGIWSSAMGLAETDRSVAGRLTPTATGFQGLTFREGPLPQMPPPPVEPPPLPVPFDEYIPKVWGACKARGADPNKEVRTFNRAALSAGYNYLPAGDSTLFCGNDKFGLKHMQKEGHDGKWSRYAGGLFAGNWRYAADYGISAALAYPETVTYQQHNATFLVTRTIRTEAQGMPIWQVNVVVSASDGKSLLRTPPTSKVDKQ